MKKNIKRIIALVCIVALVAVLAAMPLIARQEAEEEGPQASILSGNVTLGNIQNALIGGGVLAEDEAMTVTVPSEVKLKKFLVSNGDPVTEGTAMATVDRVTVMNAITQVQETLEYLSEKIEKAADADDRESVVAQAGGLVKILYAQEGDSVQQVMLEHGSLAVLSLDGLMAVDIETDSQLRAGTEVTVMFNGAVRATGEIARNLSGEMTVTLEDEDYPVDEMVTVLGPNGEPLGVGKLYVYSPWNATAYAGTVKDIKVREGDILKGGKTLMELEDVGYSAAYRQMISQRQEYEEMMLEMFKMYQTETLVAPCDGVVSGIDKDSTQLLSGQNGGISLRLLANSPNGDDETLYQNYVGKILAVAINGWALQVNPQLVPVEDYMDLSTVSLDETRMTETVLHTQTDLPVFTLTDGVWTLVDRQTLGSGDVLMFAADPQGTLVWSVLLQKQEEQPADPENPGGTTTPENPGGTQIPGAGTFPGGSFFPSGGGNFGNMGGMTQEEEFTTYSLDTVQVAAVTPQNTLTMEISVDELDVNALTLGMEAQVQIDALGGEVHTATISQIGNTGTNNGGSSKFTVELTMERTENILAGMNATATIVLSGVENVLVVPAAALVEQGNKTMIYTGYDKENEMLLNPVTVKVGSSDGEAVEILEGLAEGQEYYYAYYDTLVISSVPDFGFVFG